VTIFGDGINVSTSNTTLTMGIDKPPITVTFQEAPVNSVNLCQEWVYESPTAGATSVLTSACTTLAGGSTTISFTGVPSGPPPKSDASTFLAVVRGPESGWDAFQPLGNPQP
jgi:hypothetical protein